VFTLALVALLLVLSPALVRAQGAPADSVTLRWTAVGDDSLTGTAAAYDLRMSLSPITETGWEAATAVDGLPAPAPSGATEEVVVRGLDGSTTYYFALRVRDDAGNWSGLSNVVSWNGSMDTSPPPAPTAVTAELRGDGMHVTWSPSPSPDLAGYSVYRATSAGGPFTKLNHDLLTQTEYQDDQLPSGTSTLWYAVTATNVSGHESARSASAEGVVMAPSPALAWHIAPAYPNPGRVGEPVYIPLDLATAGAARVDIVDAAGHLVRRLDLRGLGPGHLEVEWDGRNGAGRVVAPGAYRAWLVAGEQRRCVRLARVP
jgi:hypothetical protein